jgi:hypothetical protein
MKQDNFVLFEIHLKDTIQYNGKVTGASNLSRVTGTSKYYLELNKDDAKECTRRVQLSQKRIRHITRVKSL